ncbi:hypothetical protein [Burkholderia stabilis]|uniref:hypothetical protein n=1 Tax=Burkholderia stabilis TaxID=95485 RepID=UPI0010125CFB|nr:hypothetical protein [Burkholderia stabilis]
MYFLPANAGRAVAFAGFSPACFDLSQKRQNQRIRENADLRPRHNATDYCTAISSRRQIADTDNQRPFNNQIRAGFLRARRNRCDFRVASNLKRESLSLVRATITGMAARKMGTLRPA